MIDWKFNAPEPSICQSILVQGTDLPDRPLNVSWSMSSHVCTKKYSSVCVSTLQFGMVTPSANVPTSELKPLKSCSSSTENWDTIKLFNVNLKKHSHTHWKHVLIMRIQNIITFKGFLCLLTICQ